MDECGVGAEIAKSLKQNGKHIINVTIGKQFSKVGEDAYTINPEDGNSYGDLLKSIRFYN